MGDQESPIEGLVALREEIERDVLRKRQHPRISRPVNIDASPESALGSEPSSTNSTSSGRRRRTRGNTNSHIRLRNMETEQQAAVVKDLQSQKASKEKRPKYNLRYMREITFAALRLGGTVWHGFRKSWMSRILSNLALFLIFFMLASCCAWLVFHLVTTGAANTVDLATTAGRSLISTLPWIGARWVLGARHAKRGTEITSSISIETVRPRPLEDLFVKQRELENAIATTGALRPIAIQLTLADHWVRMAAIDIEVGEFEDRMKFANLHRTLSESIWNVSELLDDFAIRGEHVLTLVDIQLSSLRLSLKSVQSRSSLIRWFLPDKYEVSNRVIIYLEDLQEEILKTTCIGDDLVQAMKQLRDGTLADVLSMKSHIEKDLGVKLDSYYHNVPFVRLPGTASLRRQRSHISIIGQMQEQANNSTTLVLDSLKSLPKRLKMIQESIKTHERDFTQEDISRYAESLDYSIQRVEVLKKDLVAARINERERVNKEIEEGVVNMSL